MIHVGLFESNMLFERTFVGHINPILLVISLSNISSIAIFNPFLNNLLFFVDIMSHKYV